MDLQIQGKRALVTGSSSGIGEAIAKTLAREGTETSGSRSSEDFAAFLAMDAKLWTRLVKDSGAKLD